VIHFDNRKGDSANFNSDFSGDVILRNKRGDCLEISGEFLIALVADYVMSQKIEKLEQATDKEILGL
jgi:hypothetical protein